MKFGISWKILSFTVAFIESLDRPLEEVRGGCEFSSRRIDFFCQLALHEYFFSEARFSECLLLCMEFFRKILLDESFFASPLDFSNGPFVINHVVALTMSQSPSSRGAVLG